MRGNKIVDSKIYFDFGGLTEQLQAKGKPSREAKSLSRRYRANMQPARVHYLFTPAAS